MIAIAALSGLATNVAPAGATSPGKNGLIVAEREGPCELGAIYTVRPNGTKRRRVASGSCETSRSVFAPTWSPNGRRLLYLSALPCWMCAESDHDKPDVVVARSDGSGKQVVAEVDALQAEWAPDGSRLAWALGNDVYVGPLDHPDERFIARAGSFGWSPDGRRLAVTEDSGGSASECAQVSIYDVATSRRERVLVRARHDGEECRASAGAPDWSPDGRRLVYAAAHDLGDRPPDDDIFVVGRNGRHRKRLTRQAGVETQPVWSPDGRFIAYTRIAGERDVYVMRADGTGKRRVLRGAFAPAWRPRPRRK